MSDCPQGMCLSNLRYQLFSMSLKNSHGSINETLPLPPQGFSFPPLFVLFLSSHHFNVPSHISSKWGILHCMSALNFISEKVCHNKAFVHVCARFVTALTCDLIVMTAITVVIITTVIIIYPTGIHPDLPISSGNPFTL